jgi:SSS family solute:Na+ symporter
VTAGIGKITRCLLAAAVITVYFSAGGLHVTARVNVLQLTVKLVGFGLALVFLFTRAGGWGATRDMVMNNASDVNAGNYFRLFGGGLSGALGYLILLTPAFIVSPGILQKIFGAQDERAVRRGVGLNALGLLGFAIIPALLGVIARGYFPALENRELALPTLLTGALPVWLGGLLLGALFSAELSAADAVLFMLTTSLSKDLYKTFFRPDADDRRLLRVARMTAIGCGCVGAGLAIWLGEVVAALRIFYTLLTAALLLPLVAGLYSKRVTARAAIAATLSSVAITFTLERLTGGRGYLGLPSLIWGALIGLIVMNVVGWIDPAKSAVETRG